MSVSLLKPSPSLVLLFIAFVWTPTVALAHVQEGQAIGLVTGFSHPWSGLDHILAMICVGLWGAQLGAPAIWLLPITFPMVMSVGALMGLLGIPLFGVEVGIALSAMILGLMVAAEIKPKMIVAIILVGSFAIFHGHAHGTELPAGQSGLLYSMGFVLGTGILHGGGILIGLLHAWPIGRGLIRTCGAFISVMGIYFLWSAL